ncbi:MAG TPA: Calx-beta domain-containing protein [Candidatus Eisenbacteria bacterium]|nr:Calx-beta domain-containing protein [Candidatus Eisenbacteria bacterium]
MAAVIAAGLAASGAALAAGITVSPTSGLATSEAGGTAQFTVVLETPPTDDVTIGISTSDPTEGTPSTASLTFTPADWSTPRTVTVHGVDDAVDDGDTGYSIVTAAASSNDIDYNGLDPADVSVTNTDDDVAGTIVTPTSGLVTTEAGGSAQFTVQLTCQPAADVTIALSSSNVGEGTVSPSSVTFTPGNWSVAQSVTVTGVDDAVVDGNVPYTILTGTAASSDPGYNGIKPPNVSVINNNNDVVGFNITPLSGLVTTEAGGTAQFTVTMTSQPTANVMLPLSSSDTSEGTVSQSSLNFTNGNWNNPRTIIVTGVNDAMVDGDIPYTIVTGPATSSDPNYSGFDTPDVSVTNTDNDVAGITVNPTSGLTTTEAGGTAQFTVVLTSQPAADVTIALSSSDASEGSESPASLVFTAANWNSPRTVTVTGVDDPAVDGNIAYTIVTAGATGADPNYVGMDAADVSVTNNDNDAVGISVSPTSGLTTTEAGGTAQFSIVLTSQPSADVTFALASSDPTEGSVSPPSVTFTAGNWNVAQAATVTGVDDPVSDGNVGYTIITGASVSLDGSYNGIDPANVSVSNTDNDAAGITVSPTSGLTTAEAGGTAQFTIVLDTQPIANVTIGLSTSDATEGNPSPGSVTFTVADWSVAQTVTVMGVDDAVVDGNVGYSIITAAATSADPAYSGLNPADVSVTNNDNDAAGITVNPTSGLVTTEAGGTAQFTIVLASQPTANVTVGLSSSDATEGTVAPASVTFTSGNWSVAQTVTVTGVDDALVDGGVGYSAITAAATSTDPVYNGMNAADVAVTNADNDAAGINVNPTSGLVTTEAGGTAQFTIVLISQPAANVTIGLSSSDATEGTVAPAGVTFTSANWNVAQTVTVTGVDDPAVDGSVEYSILTAAATSADAAYNGVDAANVLVTNTDNDAAGITVNPTAGLVTTEVGGTAQFNIVLTSQPSADVTIGLSSSDATEGTVAPSSVTFTSGNWNVAQPVTVTGVDDAVDDGNVGYSILTALATSADPGYNGLNPANVTVTNTDNDVAGFTVSPTGGLTTTEAGGAAVFTVVLNSQPTANVTVPISSNDLTEGTVAPASMTFTPANWNVAQTCTVTGVDDPVVDGNIAYTVLVQPATSADPGYNTVNPPNVGVINNDNDAAGITVNPTAGLTTTESGGTAQFTIVLTSQPSANVTVALTTSDITEGAVAPASVTFTSANWSVAQTVTVTGVDDPFVDGNVAYTIVTAPAVSADLNYVGRDAANVSVTNADNDAAGITVNPTAGLVTTEAGATAQFTVVLNSQPTADVTIGLSSSDPTEGTVAPAGVTFTSANWSVAQTVTVTGVDDFLNDGNVAYAILTAAASSADANYNGADPANVSVTNNDNDLPGVTVNPTAGLTTSEAGATAQFTVVLTSQPSANVTIGISSSDPTEGTAAPASITFTPANWSAPQAVTATGVDDAVVDGNVAYAVVTAPASSADPDYNGFDPANVAVTNTDNDAGGITVNAAPGLVTTESGGTAQFTIVLGSQPTANVSIGLSSSDATEGTVAPVSLTFTSANWNVAQTVTITGVDDALADGNVAYTILTAAASSADPTYNGRNAADVAVTNNDNDAAGVIVDPTAGLTTTEAGGTAGFTVVLSSQPTADVTIGLSSSDLTEGTVAPASLTFTTANWSVAQAVTVTGADDLVTDGGVAYTIVTAAASSTDPAYNGANPADVSVTNTDNDAVGIAVNPTSGLTTSEAGGTAQFTMVLSSQPVADVTIALSSSDLTEGTVAPASLTFTPANWNAARTVTVTGVDDPAVDGAVAYSIVTAAAVSADPLYHGQDPANVAVTNTDNDAVGFTVNPLAGLTTTEAGGAATFTVVLNSQPTASVSIPIQSSDATEGTVAPSTLVFTTADWNVPQTVTVTGVDDFVDDGNVNYSVFVLPVTSLDPAYSGQNPPNPALTNIDNDVAGITVNPTAGLTTTEAGGTATFTVVLTSQPTANVTIGLSSNDVTEGTVAPASLTFTAANWNVAQTATVTGVDDPTVDGPVAYTVVTGAGTSTDGNYGGRNAADVSVTNSDNDAAGFTVAPTAGLVTSEAGGTATFTVALTSQPAADVTIGLTSTDVSEGTVAPAGLTFSAGNWNVAQTVTVTGVDDLGADGPIAYTIVTSAAVSADGNYNGRNPADVSVTNTDNDAAGITVSPTAGLVTTEAGGTATFTVVLNTQPIADVTISLSSNDVSEGTVSPGGLTFTPFNWNLPQTVTVSGVNDPFVDGAIGYTIVTGLAVSLDPTYVGINPANVSVTNTDNDVAGVTVTPTAGLVTSEAGGTATFTVVLTSQPSANVTIGIASSDVTEGTAAPASLTFSSANWSSPRTVTVTGVDDPAVDGPVAYTVVTASATSSDANYNGMNPADVSVSNTDNDAAGITVTPTSGLVTSEAGGTATFTVRLNSQPAADVTIGLMTSDVTEGTVAPASLTFTSANWNVPQTATVTGVDDLIDDGSVGYTINTSNASSTDPNYNGRNTADVSVTNTDNDAAGITVTPTAGLVTSEAGGTASFTVVLNSQPTANVAIGLSSNDVTEGTVAPASLTFTAADWNVPQTVTLTGVDDLVDDGDLAYSILTASATSADGVYNGMNPPNVSVSNTDDDTAGITVDPVAGLTTSEGGGTASFTVVLASQPVASVTIGLSSSDPTEGTVAAGITFTAADWNVPQTVTVTGVDDASVDGAIAYTIVTAAAAGSDPVYNGQDPPDVSATNLDDDAAGISVTPVSGLITTEAGGQAHFNVVLTSQPSADVTLGLTSGDATEGAVTPASLTFTPANWNVSRIVTVTGADDFIDDGDVVYLIQTGIAASGDPAYAGLDPADVSATNIDDDAGAAVVLELIPDRDRVEPGRPVRYTLAVRNLTKLPVTTLEIRHALPERFGYLNGSAARDGRAISDPQGGRVQRFAIDTLAAFVDGNGDGVPGPGEPGYMTIGWTLAPGASATPGAYRNTAVAVAVGACSSCVISNQAEASVRVEEDGVFAHGTVLGRVFEDKDRDGRMDANETGVRGAVIALDDGTRVTTDAEGQFHLPDLDAGPRLIKLDVASLGIPATATTDVAQVMNVSPGLMATARFGVSFSRDTVTIGQPAAEGLAIITNELEHAVHIAGNAFRTALIVNGRAVGVRTVDARLNPEGSEELVRLVADSLESHAVFQTEVGDTLGLGHWRFEIRTARNDLVRLIEGDGVPPARIKWDGRFNSSRQLRGGDIYAYQLIAGYADGDQVQGPRRTFGVDRWTSIAATLGSDAFASDGTTLSTGGKLGLARVARAMRLSPREVVVIEGHMDSTGSPEASRLLSRRRAEAVLDHLVLRERVPRGRLVVEAYGEARPVAGNDTEGGRELNRRIEIYGMATEVKRAKLYDVPHRDASARVGRVEVKVDSVGRFAIELPVTGSDTIEVALTNRRGRIGIARMRMPLLAIDEPRGEVRLRFGESAKGVRVEPRAALETESEPVASLVATNGERPVAHARLLGRTDAGNRVEVDGVPVDVSRDGVFTTDLALHVGENAFSVTARDRRGTQRLASLLVNVVDRGPDGRNILAVTRIPDLLVELPPAGTVLEARELRLDGHTRPGFRVLANDDTLEVQEDGAFTGRTTLPEGRSVLKVTVVDSLGNHGVIERDVEVRSKRLFLVALADGVVGRARGQGFLSAPDDARTRTEGRIAYQLKGWIGGKYLVTSAFDTRRREFGSLFKDLDDAGRDRLLVNLDPDRLYPVFGDSSEVTYGGPGGGRFFLAVESDLVRGSIGDFPIAFDEVELASFHRTLYGAQLRLATPASEGREAGRTSVALFGAQARNIHVRDAIRATGGTLYYLSHAEVIEGSVQVALVVNDRDTGLPLRRVPLVRGLDYTAKELEGRILFARPISGVWDDGSLVSGDALSGHPVTIEVDYETRGGVGEKAAAGARVRQGLGPLSVGGTLIDDKAGAGQYQLRGGDATVRLGDVSRLGFELAESEGRVGHTFASDDGGLGFVSADTAGVQSGRAWKLAAELAPGDWGRADGLRVGGYVRRIEPGFASQERGAGEALEQFGLRGQLDAGRWGMWSARYDQDTRGKSDSTAGRSRDVLGLHWHRDGKRTGVATEFEQRSLTGWGVADSSASSVAGRFWWSPIAPLRATIERRQSVGGPDLNRTALGIQWQVLSKLALGMRASDGTTGSELRGDATITLGRRSAYLRQERFDEFGRRRTGTLLGVQAPLGAMGRTYSEYQWQRDASGDRALSVMGVEQGWRTPGGLLWRIAGEHGNRAGVPGTIGSTPTTGVVAANTGERTTVSSDLSFRGKFPVSGGTRGEYRMDKGAGRQEQFLSSTHLEWSLIGGFALRGDYRLSVTRQLDLQRTPARFEESSIGLAYRPVRSDRVQALARWTRLDDRRALVPGDSLSSESGLDVAALETSVRLTETIEWSGKGAARIIRDGREGLAPVATHGSLWISRVDYAVRKPVKLGVEYRLLAQRETNDKRRGWLQEVSWDPAAHFRLGLGYNFTHFSGDLLDRGEEDSRGWFIRAQSRY